MLELDAIYNMDCLEGMKQIPDGTIDAVICDLPYGTMVRSSYGSKEEQFKAFREWDYAIPTEPLFEQYERVLRRGGVCVLFSAEPYTSHLRTFKAKNMDFVYPMIWKKDSPGNAFHAKDAPIGYYEDINVFKKSNPIVRDMNSPLREYARKLIKYTGFTATKLKDDLVKNNVPNPNSYRDFFSPNAEWLFKLCMRHQYDVLIERYHIDKMEGFKTWDECKVLWDASNVGKLGENVFNLPEGATHLPNILDFSKDTDGFHPTQKPVALIRRLVLTYTNEGDTVLDNCMGSGTTAIACIKERRHFIGFELNKEYFDKACKRIDIEQRQLTLF